MKILALEFSSPRRSVAVVESGDGANPVVLGSATETGGRNTQAIGLVEAALSQAGMEREAIECLAVGIGPGSYTGIRAAISLAQGWQLARGVKLLGVSSVECLAVQAQAEAIHGQVSCVIDAQRNEFYLATYEVSSREVRFIEPLRLVNAETVRVKGGGGRLIGPEPSPLLPGLVNVFPTAAVLGTLAACRTDFIPGEALEPIYLRETNFVKAPPPRFIPE